MDTRFVLPGGDCFDLATQEVINRHGEWTALGREKRMVVVALKGLG